MYSNVHLIYLQYDIDMHIDSATASYRDISRASLDMIQYVLICYDNIEAYRDLIMTYHDNIIRADISKMMLAYHDISAA